MSKNERKVARRGYPLVALFILTAVCAVLFALITPLARAATQQNIAGNQLPAALLAGGVVTCLIGIGVGFFHHEQPRGTFTGGVIGLFVGPLFGAMTLIPVSAATSVLAAAIGGSIMLVVIGALLRISSSGEPGASDRLDE